MDPSELLEEADPPGAVGVPFMGPFIGPFMGAFIGPFGAVAGCEGVKNGPGCWNGKPMGREKGALGGPRRGLPPPGGRLPSGVFCASDAKEDRWGCREFFRLSKSSRVCNA